MTSVTVRYIVDDVAGAAAFYRDRLGFEVVMNPGPGFAMLTRGELRLLLNTPGAGAAGQAMPDGTAPEPGGWGRFQIETDDLVATVAELKEAGATFRNEIVGGRGGQQVLIEDPSGNVVELFQPSDA